MQLHMIHTWPEPGQQCLPSHCSLGGWEQNNCYLPKSALQSELVYWLMFKSLLQFRSPAASECCPSCNGYLPAFPGLWKPFLALPARAQGGVRQAAVALLA